MAVLQVEVVVGPIEVGWHHGDVVGAILEVVALTHLQSCYLGDGILLVGIFQRRGEQRVLPHRLRRILRIDAGRSEEEQLLHLVAIGTVDDVALHLQVLHDEVGAVERVGHDATHEGSREHDRLGAFGLEKLLHGPLVREVELGMGSSHEVVVASVLQVLPDGRTDQSTVAGDINLGIFIQHNSFLRYSVFTFGLTASYSFGLAVSYSGICALR